MPDRWSLVERLFGEAVERDPEAREAYLREACLGDPTLLDEVSSLLAAHDGAGPFLETPVVARDANVGAVLRGRYRVERELGRGGFGVVYLARDLQLLSKPVVVKVLSPRPSGGGSAEWFRSKFRQEIEALARIDHPGVVGVLDSGETDDGRPFLVMQYVDGVSLRAEMRAGTLAAEEVASVLRQVGHALTAAHARGVCHRDLKPENVMLQRLEGGEPHARIIDFGVAKVQDPQSDPTDSAAMIVGTVSYMAPEQLRGGAVTPATDVYALGVMAYELLCGRLPFPADAPGTLADAQRAGVAVAPRTLRPDLPEAAERALIAALAFDPADRPPRARDLAETLAGALAEGVPGALADTLVGPEGAAPLESVGGAVPLGSTFYTVRPADAEFQSAVARGDSIVLVKGARQMGKTSLLARGLQTARERGARVILTDFQRLDAASFASTDALFLAIADLIAEQLDLEADPHASWSPSRSANRNFERFLKRDVLGETAAPVVWGLDEVDRLFAVPFGGDVFGLFRSWHNARSLDPAGPWARLTMAIAYATEAHLFIADVNQSPFNVGTRLELSDFTREEVLELDRRYGGPLADGPEVDRFMRLFGGHPYLVRLGLHEMAAHGLALDDLERLAESDSGPFADHLRRLATLLAHDAETTAALRAVLAGKPCPTPESFFRLRSAGLLAGDSSHEARPRCRLYALYLASHVA